jgi:Invasion associated locus B (IalB) protein
MPLISSQDIRSWGVPVALLLAATLMASSALAQQPPAPAKPAPAAPKPEAKTTLAAATPNDVQPTLLGQYGDWAAYYATPGGKKVCFSIAKPKSSLTNPTGRKRDQAWLFVADRPAENVHNEVSVIIGYPFKPQTEASAEIGSAKFAMYTLNDGAWIKNVAEEARLVDAMRKGSDLTIKGMSGHGTESTDQYALKGLSQAIEKADQECK